MTWTAARARIVTIVGAAVPSTKAKGLGDKFAHDTTISEQVHGAERRFGVKLLSGGRWGPAQTVANVVVGVVVVLVDYAQHVDAAGVDVAIGADYEVISRALADESKWERSTSTIRCLGATSEDGGQPLFPFSIVDHEGGQRLRIIFPAEFSS